MVFIAFHNFKVLVYRLYAILKRIPFFFQLSHKKFLKPPDATLTILNEIYLEICNNTSTQLKEISKHQSAAVLRWD